MEILNHEIGIPRKHIKETGTKNRFIVIVNKNWLKILAQDDKVTNFIIHSGFDDWPSYDYPLERSWSKVYFNIYKKCNHKVVPLRHRPPLNINLTNNNNNISNDNEQPLSFSQLLHYISQNNHKNLWKTAYKKYSASRQKPVTTQQQSTNLCDSPKTQKNNEHSNMNLVPHDVVLRDVIQRVYGCNIIQFNSEKTIEINYENITRKTINENGMAANESHVNLYPTISAIETNSHIIVVHDLFIEHTMYDCITYSPSILDKSNNKTLFIIYQLLNLMKVLHDRGIMLGNIELTDIYVNDNLWLYVMPKLESNITRLEGCSEIQDDELDVMSASNIKTIANDYYNMKYINNSLHNDLNLNVTTLKDYCDMWCYGSISNFDYLTILNNFAGRKINCPDYNHIMPWVTNFLSRNGSNWRDLTKSKYRLNKGDPQLDLTFTSTNGTATAHHVSDVLSEITYYVYMARRTPKNVLRKHVRRIWVPAEYPASIQRLQEWSPDECIPEFFNDPLVFKSIHEDLPDLEVPLWSSCPEDFITKHREALESQYVSERLHHWIDLTFGYKLSGKAAIKAKNVCLSLVDAHKNLCQRGVVQLFSNPHPPRLQHNIWTGKIPPRIYSQNEIKRRLTRSSEDLSLNIANASVSASASESVDMFDCENNCSAGPSKKYPSSPKSNNKINPSTEAVLPSTLSSPFKGENMERSTSYHQNVQKSSNLIILPKEYNPIYKLNTIENMEIFKSKTFHPSKMSKIDKKDTVVPTIDNYDINKINHGNYMKYEEYGNAFTNRIFAETYEAAIKKDNKLLQNMQNRNYIAKQSRNIKQIISENRIRELQIIGCIIIEIFLSDQIRPLGIYDNNINFDKRLQSCLTILKNNFHSLPKCVQYSVKLLLHFDINNDNISIVDNNNLLNNRNSVTDKGLPNASAHQFLQPLLSNTLFPFPLNYLKIYSLVKTLKQFESSCRLLDLFTYYDCDGKHCLKYESVDKTKIIFNRKIAECKVKACVIQIEGLLEPVGYEQFNVVELLLPHIIDLIKSEDTSILTAWYLFDPLAMALGPKDTQAYLLEPILQLYDADNKERTTFLNSNYDASMKFTTSSSFKSKKSVKLYHHSFLLKIIVRFGLRCFLDNFISPLIEAVGGYKDPDTNLPYHYHNNNKNNELKRSRSTKNFNYTTDTETISMSESSRTVISPDQSDKTLSPSFDNNLNSPNMTKTDVPLDNDELFEFEVENCDNVSIDIDNSTNINDNNNVIMKIIDQFDLKSDSSMLDLRLNHSHAEEVTEDTQIIDEQVLQEKINYKNFITNDIALCSGLSYSDECFINNRNLNLSFDDDHLSQKSSDSPQKTPTINVPNTLKSPTIPIPSMIRRSHEVNSIGCDIGSKKSFDSNDFLNHTPNEKDKDIINAAINNQNKLKESDSCQQSTKHHTDKSNRLSEMSAESLIWLSHRLGPVLSARFLTRNLLKMLTLCYVGQENLLPDCEVNENLNLNHLSIADGRVIGDQNAFKVLECLTSISMLFGEQFILLQYLPHVGELIALCKKRTTSSLEGGLISTLQLLKFLVPHLSDTTIMDQLHDTILGTIIHPIIRLLGSSRCTMPGGFLARSVLARKLVDAIYVLAIRIGPEMTREHLCVPALQRFFLIFDKAYRIIDRFKDNRNDIKHECSPNESSDDTKYIEIKRDGGFCEWRVKGLQITQARVRGQDSFENSSPHTSTTGCDIKIVREQREKALEEIRDVFTPNLAHTCYLPFLKYLGEIIMLQTIKNIHLILNLCHEHEQPEYIDDKQTLKTSLNLHNDNNNRKDDDSIDLSITGTNSNSFGTNVAVIGNRIDVQQLQQQQIQQQQQQQIQQQPQYSSNTETINLSEKDKLLENDNLLNLLTYKIEQLNTSRHLRGNWLAYWEHEIGRSDKDINFNLKQIKLQSFNSHTNAVRSILSLDNENSFMSASKDKTVKLWSLRSEGDGNKMSPCQFTYINHKKSVHSLAFLESARLTVSCDSSVHIWDPFVGAQVTQLDSTRYSPVTIVKTYPAPSSLILAGTNESSIKIIDSRTFGYVNEWKITSQLINPVRCMTISSNGSWIAVGLGAGQIVLIDGRNGLIINNWRANDGELLQLATGNDQQLISSSLDHTISVWSTLDGSLLYNVKNLQEPAHCIAVSGNELIAGTPANKISVHSLNQSMDNLQINHLHNMNATNSHYHHMHHHQHHHHQNLSNINQLNSVNNYSITKLRSDTFKGVLTSFSILPLNRMLLVGGDNGNISLLC